jgi:transcriptional regulator with XRE-family HTH domain
MRLLEFERRKRRWSQAHLADLAGLPQSDISLLETGRLRPSPSQSARLAAVLGIAPDALLLTLEDYIIAEPTGVEATR